MARKKQVIDLETYNALDSHAIALNEWYKSLRKAGFSVDLALGILVERNAFPDWILPVKPIEKIGDVDYDEDDD